MSQIVVDTDVASYIFNGHSLAQQYVNALRGSDLILSFMSVAELRMGAMSAGWCDYRRLLLEQFCSRFRAILSGRRPLLGLGENPCGCPSRRPANQPAGRLDRCDWVGIGLSCCDEQSSGFRACAAPAVVVSVTNSVADTVPSRASQVTHVVSEIVKIHVCSMRKAQSAFNDGRI